MKHCMFCNSRLTATNKAREHILSKHLLSSFLLNKIEFEHSDFATVDQNFCGGHISIQTKQRKPAYGKFLAGRVCNKCNNGWMNRLEVAVRPYLYPLMNAEISLNSLSDEQCYELACWYLKTAVALSRSIRAPQFKTHDSHAQFLCSTDGTDIPPDVAVFAAPARSNQFLWSLCPTWNVETTTDLADVLPNQYAGAYKIFFQLGRIMLLACYWPHDYRLYTYESWGIRPLSKNRITQPINKDCRDCFAEESLNLMMGTGVLLSVEGYVPQVGRNDPCPCASGKKYKACHGIR